jgi:thiosulfate dehydrogenase
MGKFVLGIVVGAVGLVLAGWAYSRSGYMPVNADVAPGTFERYMASTALDASIERQAPKVKNPVPITDANLIDGMKFYTMNCAQCHGELTRKESPFGESFYPAAPQLILHPLDDPEWHIFYAVKHGIARTGMPAWGKTASDDDLWKVTVQEKWKAAFSTR